MVNNQIEFNNTYSKEKKVIRFRDEKNFQGELIVEDYPNLEKLYLREVKNVDKIILKNLTQLQEFTFLGCNTRDLVIENCPQIKKLNIENNLLTSLEFVKDLTNLEELEIDGNNGLIELLKPYQGDWKIYKKIIQGSNKDAQELLKLSQQKYDELKKFLKETFILLSKDAKQELVSELDKKTKRKDSISASGRTKELILNTQEVIKSVKEIKKDLESELDKSKAKIQELEQELAKKNELYKEKEIELKFKQKEADKLLDKLLEKSAEKERTTDEGEKEKFQKEIDDLKQKLSEAKEREFELRGELKAKREEIERMSQIIDKAIAAPKVQNMRHTPTKR